MCRSVSGAASCCGQTRSLHLQAAVCPPPTCFHCANPYLCSYPHFNPQEMLEVAELHTALKAKAKGGSPTPIVTFNAELDRIRTGEAASNRQAACRRLLRCCVSKATLCEPHLIQAVAHVM